MKNLLYSLALAMMAILSPALAQAHDFAVGGVYYNITSSNEVAVTYKGDSPYSGGYSGNVTIPRMVSYNGTSYNVTSIGEMAFVFCEYLQKVTVGSMVTSIGESAFLMCSNLYSVSLPSSLTSIGVFAFGECSNLMSITLPNSLITIGSNAFRGSGLMSVSIPQSVTTIGSYAFGDCYELSSVTIPSTVTHLGKNPFIYCSNLRSIKVQSGNPNYDSRGGCNAIIETATSTLISGCMTTIIPSTVTTLGEGSFGGCTGLTAFSVPSTLTTIGSYAYEGCSGLSSVTIPSTVTTMGANPFYGCEKLKNIKVESGNPNYDSRGGCNAIIETAANRLITGCMTTTIPRSVTALGNESFGSCTGLTTIDIPNSITDMGEWTFFCCTGLESIVIPNSVKVIKDRVFDSCYKLASVTLPNSLTSIGESAFYYCEELPTITIPATVSFIGESAFEGCDNLRDVYTYIKSPADMTVEDDAFSLITSNYWGRRLNVPAGTQAAYKADKRWSNYFRIIEEMPAVTPGDVDGNGEVNISDVSQVISAILGGGNVDASADVDGNGEVNISDVNTIIAIILQ